MASPQPIEYGQDHAQDAILPGDRGAWDRGYSEGYMSGWKACERWSERAMGDVQDRVKDARWMGIALGLTIASIAYAMAWVLPI